MSIGIAINIGVNSPKSAPTPLPDLDHAQTAAARMSEIAAMQGFTTTGDFAPLLGPSATRDAVRDALEKARKRLGPGDTLLLSYAGHSCQVDDLNGDENDGLDEAWCLADKLFLDDELFGRLSRFDPKVRVVLVLDTCFADGATLTLRQWLSGNLRAGRALATEHASWSAEAHAALTGFAQLPPPVDIEDIRAVQEEFTDGRGVELQASVLLLSSCRENEKSRDGLFTNALYDMFKPGPPPPTYGDLYAGLYAAVTRVDGSQHPTFRPMGVPDLSFFCGKPF